MRLPWMPADPPVVMYTETAGIFHPVNEDPSRRRIERLADYHAERLHGLVHTPEWDAFMAEEQAWFDARKER